MSVCAPKPRPEDFRNKKGKIRWSAYNKAMRKYNRCVRIEARLDPEVVAERQETLRQALDELGDLAKCVRIGRTFQFQCPDGSTTTATPAQVAAYEQKEAIQQAGGWRDYALPAAAIAAAAFLFRR